MKYPPIKKIQKLKHHAKFLTDEEIAFLTSLNKADQIKIYRAYIQQLQRYRTYLQTTKSIILARKTTRESSDVLLSDGQIYNLDEAYMFAFEKGYDSVSQDYKNMDDIMKILKNQLTRIEYAIAKQKKKLRELQKL